MFKGNCGMCYHFHCFLVQKTIMITCLFSSHHMQVHAHTTIGEGVGPPYKKLFQFHPFVDHRNLSSVIN